MLQAKDERFCLLRVLPLLSFDPEDKRPTYVASGFFFQRSGRVFLITAYHCLANLIDAKEEVALPTSPFARDTDGLVTVGIGNARAYRALDLVVYEVGSELLGRLTEWHKIDDSEIAPDGRPANPVLIAGWPGRLLEITWNPGDRYTMKGVLEFKELAFLRCDDDGGIYLDHAGMTVRDVEGMSGCPIWARTKEGDGLSSDLKLFGMECGIKEGVAVRGINWRSISGAIDEALELEPVP